MPLGPSFSISYTIIVQVQYFRYLSYLSTIHYIFTDTQPQVTCLHSGPQTTTEWDYKPKLLLTSAHWLGHWTRVIRHNDDTQQWCLLNICKLDILVYDFIVHSYLFLFHRQLINILSYIQKFIYDIYITCNFQVFSCFSASG